MDSAIPRLATVQLFVLHLGRLVLGWCACVLSVSDTGLGQPPYLIDPGYHSTIQQSPPRQYYQQLPDSHGPVFLSSQPWTTELLPKGNLYGTYWASVAEPKLSTTLSSESALGTLLDSNISARLGLFKYGLKDRPIGFQLDLLGSAKLRQNTGAFDVLATDYRYDILGTFSNDRHRLKLGFYHVSSHLGDEFLLNNPTYDRLNYYRDSLVAGYSFYPTPSLRLYGEIGWAFQHEVSEPLEFQFGFDYGPRYWTGFCGAPFLAANVHLREEVDFGGNGVVQAGWAWRGEDPTSGTLRVGLEYYNGKSRQFSFFNEHESQLGFGIWYDF